MGVISKGGIRGGGGGKGPVVLASTVIIQGGPKVSTHTLALIAHSLSAQSK